MLKYTVRRFFEMILTLFIIATATFFMLEAVPGDPLSERVERLPESVAENLYHKYGLDKPTMERYVITMKGMLKGDFGESVRMPGYDIHKLLEETLAPSARLGLQSIIVGIGLGLLLGILAAMFKGTWIDYLIVFFSVLMISVPTLIFGLLLQKYVAGELGWFPIIGWPKGKELWFGGWKYTILPTLSGCFSYVATYSRLLKTSMLDVINQDYVLAARAKGLSEPQIVRRHILRNAFIPIITVLPMSIAFALTGSFFIEKIYSIPGFGRYFIEAIQARDLSIVMGQTVLMAALYIAVVFLVDILYTLVDPRIRVSGKR
ncbi:MAG: ABC transporter permease [Oscillospiraceae bacterium]|jgi:oligopeptide transport system permease protein|nr:ABC transporter permease [Oscillospiraceae bacterium]